MKTKEINLKNKTFLTLYFNEKEAETLVEKLNSIHSRYKFYYEEEISVNKVYLVYCLHNRDTDKELIDEILTYLLDRMTYGLN